MALLIPADLRPLIHQGDVLDLLRQLPEETFHAVVSSVPYWRMRDYGVEGQDGLEETVEAYVSRQVDVWREVRRVLRSDGTAWLNIGDTYVGGGHGSRGTTSSLRESAVQSKFVDAPKPTRRMERIVSSWAEGAVPPGLDKTVSGRLKRKDLALVPFRLAIALQDDGWWVREAIIWAKPNGIPEPSRGRPVRSHEYILLLAKSERYFYDGFAVRQPSQDKQGTDRFTGRKGLSADGFVPRERDGGANEWAPTTFRPTDGLSNLRSVWSIPMEPYPGEHFAPFPTEIPRRAILAGTSARGACATCGTPWTRKAEAKGGTIGSTVFRHDIDSMVEGRNQWIGVKAGEYVQRDLGFEPGCSCGAGVAPCLVLDPYAGSGTTLQVARELGRRSVGLELNPKYVELARARSTADIPDILEAPWGT